MSSTVAPASSTVAKKIYRKCQTLRSCKLFIGIFILVLLIAALYFSLQPLEDRNGKQGESPLLLGSKFGSKILCYVLLPSSYIDAGLSIKDTWGSKCDKLLFFGRFINKELPTTYLNSSEGYRFLWGKTKAALLHLAANYSQDYDWFFKADHDTFVVVENLRHFVSRLDPKDPLWFGYKLKHPELMTGYMSGGAGYGFSKAALLKVTRILKSNLTTPKGTKCRSQSAIGLEDIELGKCFTASGVRDESTLDNLGKERFLPLPIETLWKEQVPPLHWLWRQAWNPLVVGRKCCSSHIITTHQVSPQKMRTLYRTLYKMKTTRN